MSIKQYAYLFGTDDESEALSSTSNRLRLAGVRLCEKVCRLVAGHKSSAYLFGEKHDLPGTVRLRSHLFKIAATHPKAIVAVEGYSTEESLAALLEQGNMAIPNVVPLESSGLRASISQLLKSLDGLVGDYWRQHAISLATIPLMHDEAYQALKEIDGLGRGSSSLRDAILECDRSHAFAERRTILEPACSSISRSDALDLFKTLGRAFLARLGNEPRSDVGQAIAKRYIDNPTRAVRANEIAEHYGFRLRDDALSKSAVDICHSNADKDVFVIVGVMHIVQMKACLEQRRSVLRLVDPDVWEQVSRRETWFRPP